MANSAKRAARALIGLSTRADANHTVRETANFILQEKTKMSELQSFSPAIGKLTGELDGLTILRPGIPEDRPYVEDSWLLSGRSQGYARDAGPGYAHDMKWLIRRLLDRGALLVACDKDEPGAIWGWALTRGTTVVYVYVRQEFRRKGLAKALLAPFFAHDGPVVYCARPRFPMSWPRTWRYSFLHAVRLAAE